MTWEYITGFFDADGSITCTAPNRGKNKTIQVSFHNNEISILEEIKDFIQQELNVKGHISKKSKQKENHHDSYDLKYVFLSALKVVNKMQSIHPKKKHRIDIYNLIQSKTNRNGKYSEQELQERENLINQFFQM